MRTLLNIMTIYYVKCLKSHKFSLNLVNSCLPWECPMWLRDIASYLPFNAFYSIVEESVLLLSFWLLPLLLLSVARVRFRSE